MRIIKVTALACCLMASGQWALAQKPDLTGVEIITFPVSGNVYMLEATGDVAGNIGVSVGKDGILIIDDQWSELSGKIEEALAELAEGKPETGPLKYIINTHHHDDHMEGNANLSRNSGATIIAHNKTRERLLEWGEEYLPVLTFDNSLSLHFNGEEIQALAFPGGHTDNDIVIFFKGSNVVHMGDLFNSGISSFPTADYSAGGDAFLLPGILEKILPLIPDDAKIIAGHGPLSDKKGLIQTYEMIRETTALVGSKLDKGMSLKSILIEGLPEKYSEWGYGYTDEGSWIEMIYGSYLKNN